LASLQKNYRACKSLARQADKDRYLSALFAPKERRRYLFAISAFNYEVARIRDRVSEPMIGELRLQWWRDAVEGRGPNDASHGPITNALVDTISHCDLPRARFHELIDARTFDLYGDPMPTLAQFEIYLDSTSTSLMQLAARILDQTETREIDETALHAGRAYAITGLLRSFPHHASRGQVYIPQDLLARHSVTHDDIISGQATEGVRASLREMRDLARFHLMEARNRMVLLPKAVLPAFLPVEMVPDYLARMERPDYDPFTTQIQLPQFLRPWTIWRSARRLKSRR
jgi:phytoene synthase